MNEVSLAPLEMTQGIPHPVPLPPGEGGLVDDLGSFLTVVGAGLVPAPSQGNIGRVVDLLRGRPQGPPLRRSLGSPHPSPHGEEGVQRDRLDGTPAPQR